MAMQVEPPLMERLLNMAPVGILLLDAAGRISSVNSTLLEFLNVDADDLQGKGKGDLSEPQLQLLFEQQTIFVPASGNQPERWLKCDSHQLDSNWKIHYYTDITRQHRMEGEQRRMEEALREHSSTDPETGLFIAEGEWRELPAEVRPGGRAEFELALELPPERGRYHVYVSLLGRDGGWFYVRGGEFLLVECTVAEGRAALVECRPATLARLRRRRLGRALVRAFTYPIRTMLANRSLIGSMVRRDIASRYRGSIGDAAWTVLNPLLLMATYFFVFGIVLRTRFGGGNAAA